MHTLRSVYIMRARVHMLLKKLSMPAIDDKPNARACALSGRAGPGRACANARFHFVLFVFITHIYRLSAIAPTNITLGACDVYLCGRMRINYAETCVRACKRAPALSPRPIVVAVAAAAAVRCVR